MHGPTPVRGTGEGPVVLFPHFGALLGSKTFMGASQHTTLQAFIDSGAAESFLDAMLAAELGLPIEPLERPLPVMAIDGRSLGSGPVTHHTGPVTLRVGPHSESTVLYLTQAPHLQLVLGFPWLRQNNPRIDWSTQSVYVWDPRCNGHCLVDPGPL